jgi:hypothetical protein
MPQEMQSYFRSAFVLKDSEPLAARLERIRKAIRNQIRPHLQRLLAFFFGVVVDALIFPAIAEVAFVGVEEYKPSLVDQAETFGGFPVVLVDLGKTFREIKFLVVDGMLKGDGDEFQLWKYFLQLDPDKFVETVVVVHMEEAAAGEIFPQICCFHVIEHHVAVARHVYIRIEEQFTASNFDDVLFGCEVQVQFLVRELDEIRERCLVGVPVAAAIVLQLGDADRVLC